MHPKNTRPPVAAIVTSLLTAFISSTACATDTELGQVVVTATRTATRASEVLSDISTVEREEIERAGQNTLTELLSTLPGVQMTSNGGRGSSGSFSIRGSNTNQVLVLIDGQRLSSATTGATALEHIPLEQVERIEVLRGPASALYGADALGGVIQIFTRAGEGKPAPSLSLGVGRYGTSIGSLAYGGRSGDTRFNVQAGWESSSGFSSIKEAKGGTYDMFNEDRDPYRNLNFSGRLAQRVSSDLEIGADLMRIEAEKHFDSTNCDDFGTVCTANFDNRQRQNLASYATYANYQVLPNWKTSLRLGQSQDKTTNWRFDPSNSLATEQRYNTTQNQMGWQNDFSTAIGKLMAALEWREAKVESTQTFVYNTQKTRALILGYQGWLGAHSLQASARTDNIERMGTHSTGSLAYGYRLTDAWTARAGVGTAFHAPTFNDLYWPLDLVNFFQGNPNLKPERARTREIGLAYDRAGVTAGITAYQNKVADLLDYVAGVAPTWIGTYGNVNNATLQGASLHYARHSSDWDMRFAYDVLSARDDLTQRTLQRRAPRTAFAELTRHIGQYDVGAKVQAVGRRFNDNANKQSLGGYAVVDLDASYRIGAGWTALAKLSNLFGKDYTLVRSTMAPYNDYAVAGRGLFLGVRYTPK